MNDLFHLDKVVDVLERSSNVLFITGAGISADSGLPTYRGVGGLYNGQKTEEGMAIEKALSGPVFQKNPEITWKYLYQIERSCRGASYNSAHEIIAQIEKEIPRVWVLTQNIDGFHKQAGSQNVIEIHGSLYNLECTGCHSEKIVSDYSFIKEIPPLCEGCGSILRPAVVLFEEMLIPEKIMRLESELMNGFDLIFSIGTTSVFPYIAGPVYQAARSGIYTVEINPEETEVSSEVTYRLAVTAKKAMSEIYGLWQKTKKS